MTLAMAIMPTYERYKDSEIDWIGDIPEHWELKPFRALFHFRNEKNDPVKTDNVLSLSIANGVTEYTEEGRGGNKRKDDLAAYKLAYPDDIVLNSMNVIVGAVGLSKYFGAISPVYYALYLRSEENNIHYFENTFLDESFQRGLLRHGKGIMMKLSGTGKLNTIRMKVSTNDLKKIYFPYPPKAEQDKIVSFLSDKTAQIDEAIGIKEQQITLLKERKQIIIQNAVTKGLNSNPHLKHSSVDWLGDVPSHWKEVRFKYIFSQSRLPVDPNDGVVTAYRDGQVTLRSNRRMDGYTEAFLEQGYQGIRNGQLVLNSMDAFEGAIGVSDSNGKCTPEYVVCNPITDEVSQFYYAYLLREMALSGYIQVICNAVRQRAVRIRYSNLAPLFMIMPPLDEQNKIVSYIEVEKAKIKTGILNFEQQINKLKEYKASLINNAVTGKIKVI